MSGVALSVGLYAVAVVLASLASFAMVRLVSEDTVIPVTVGLLAGPGLALGVLGPIKALSLGIVGFSSYLSLFLGSALAYAYGVVGRGRRIQLLVASAAVWSLAGYVTYLFLFIGA